MRFPLILLFATALGIKLLFFLLDSQPAFHFGDSASYLATAIAGYIPRDRSFTYGFLLRPLVLGTHSLSPAVLFQTMLSTVASFIAGLCLLCFFRTSFTIAFTCTVLCALDPLQLMSERLIMTENAATFGFAVLFLACLLYLKCRELAALLFIQAWGVLLVSIRVSFLPLVLVLSLALPLLPNQIGVSRPMRRIGEALLVAVLSSQALLWGYRHLYAHLAHDRPAYLSQDGYFLLADVSPIIIPADFPIAAKREQVFGHLTFPLRNPDSRRPTRWMQGGLCDAVIKAANNDEARANRLARQTAVSAIRRDPLGVLWLGAFTYREFFDREKLLWTLRLEQGQMVDPDANEVALMHYFPALDVTHRDFNTVVGRWQNASTAWCWIVILTPLLLLFELILHRRRTMVADWLTLLCSFTFLTGAVIPVDIASPRYLLPLSWLTLISIGSAWSRIEATIREWQARSCVP